MMITETLPGDEYCIQIPQDRVAEAKLFVSRNLLIKHCHDIIGDNKTIAEVGVFLGDNSITLRDTFKPSKLYLVDTFDVDGHIIQNRLQCSDCNTHFQYVIDRFKDIKEIEICRGCSWDQLELLPDDSIDYMYIDADHSYESVCKDIAVAYKKIKNNGIIQFNDYTTSTFNALHRYGVLQAVNEFMEQYDMDIIGLSLERSGYHDLAVRVHKAKHAKGSLVTPCTRPENLDSIMASIDFDKINLTEH